MCFVIYYYLRPWRATLSPPPLACPLYSSVFNLIACTHGREEIGYRACVGVSERRDRRRSSWVQPLQTFVLCTNYHKRMENFGVSSVCKGDWRSMRHFFYRLLLVIRVPKTPFSMSMASHRGALTLMSQFLTLLKKFVKGTPNIQS